MTDPAGDELRALRRRAYGPAADIHLDPTAARRLRELENGEVTAEASESADAAAPDTEAAHTPASSPDDAADLSPTSDEPDPPPTERRRIRFAPRRSTVLIAIAVALFVVAVVVVLTLVQRVQTDPLQVGATQVARLSIDFEYDAPAILSGDRTRGLLAFDDFYGLRTVVQEPGDTGADDECMIIYQPEYLEVSDSGYSYSGQLSLRACAAGVFPAAVTFTVPGEFPEQLQEVYPVGTPLQFVYDKANNEIVIFAG